MTGVRMRVLVGLATLSVLAVACGGDAKDGGGSMGGGPTGATAATGPTDSGDDPAWGACTEARTG